VEGFSKREKTEGVSLARQSRLVGAREKEKVQSEEAT